MGQRFSSKRNMSSPAPKGDPMELKVQTVNGDVHPVSVESGNSLLELYEAVANVLDVDPWTLRLTAGTTFLDVATDGPSLEDLGIKEETELMALRCRGCFLENPGESRYNADYCCSVLQVRQAGWNTIEVEFSVRCDGSLGRLQTPNHSKLSFIDTTAGKKKSPKRFVRPESVRLEVDEDVDDGPSHKKGIMTFEGVPTDGVVWFVYGVSGYAPLSMDLSVGRE
ncbi:unnamed protein product [Symbiodinium sp. CCMP2592]|nr:unnamed protein product [Symbiodinium sp. CCMP2592]